MMRFPHDTNVDRHNTSVLARSLTRRDLALSLLDKGDVTSARWHASRAARDIAAHLPDSLPELASTMLVLGMAEFAAGRRRHGRVAYKAAADALPEPGVDEDTTRLWCQIQLALAEAERDAGDSPGAERRLRRLLEVAGRAFEAHDDILLESWNGLGMLFKYAARFDEAEAAYGRVLDAVDTESDVDRLLLAGLFHNLGGLEHARGHPEEGIGWAERGLALRSDELGPDHPEVAADLNALGALYQQAARFVDAADAYGKALTIFESCYGPGHYEVAMTVANQAALATDEARPLDAIELGQRSLTMLEALLGHSHVDVGLTLHNLGVAHLDAGLPAEAVVILDEALGVLIAALPVGHPQLNVTRHMLADAGRG